MLETSKYIRKTKTALKKTKRQLRKISKSRYIKDKRIWTVALVAIVLAVFWVLPAFAAKAPGQVGYGIKRAEESIASNLAPLSSWRDSLRLNFANRRVAEAAYVANQANQNSHSNQTKTAATITNLLNTYEDVYEVRTATLNQELSNNKKPSK